MILANPPFSGRLDRDRIVDDVKIGASTAIELLFVKYMIDNLKRGGRCRVVAPEGVLSNSRVGHKELRRMLMQNNRMEAVLSLPSLVFQPYSRRQYLGPHLRPGRANGASHVPSREQ
jgi:type I restriction enzyme M protein